MSNELIIGIIVTIIVGVPAYFISTNKNKVSVKVKSKKGNATISNSTIGNEIDKKQ